MKRDMNLVRELLLLIEDKQTGGPLRLPGHIDVNVAASHLVLTEQAGYTKNNILYADDEAFSTNAELTWHGHEFLDSIKNDAIWSKTKEVIISKGLELGSVSFGVVKDLAALQLKKLLGAE